MRFRFFPSALAGCAALSEATGLRTIPLRRSIRLAPPPEAGGPRMDFVLAVFALVFAPCVHRARLAPLRTTAHAGPTGSCVAVSLWRDVPLPAFNRTLTQLGRTGVSHAGRSGNAPGIFLPFAVFPVRGSRRL